jgi:hypothetical protein
VLLANPKKSGSVGVHYSGKASYQKKVEKSFRYLGSAKWK